MKKNHVTEKPSDAKRSQHKIVEQLYELLQIKRMAKATAKGEFSDRLFMTTLQQQEEALNAELLVSLAQPRRRGWRKSAR